MRLRIPRSWRLCQYSGDPSGSMRAGCLLMGLAAVSCCNLSLTAERRGAVVSTTTGFLYINFVLFSHTVQELP